MVPLNSFHGGALPTCFSHEDNYTTQNCLNGGC